MKITVVWFKTDLRLNDNETLVKAIAQSDQIIPVYCFDESHFGKSDFGFQKTGSYRATFLLESIQDLDKNLRALGSGLIIAKGKPEEEIPKIVKQYNANKVVAKREVAFEEKRTEALVQEALFKIKCELETFSTSTLYHAEDLPFSIKNIPDVFTNFRKQTEKEAQIRPAFETPIKIKSPQIEPVVIPSIEELGLSFQSIDSRAAIVFKGGENEALKRLNHYFEGTGSISTYKETRNGLIGADYSSKFSAWLALGCISPRFIYQELKKYEQKFGSNESTYWLVFELIWRDYFRFIMKKYNAKLFLQSGIKTNEIQINDTNSINMEAWINGETGVDFVDANMIE
jgi:deoxyribodipyrimidine photo-lyase